MINKGIQQGDVWQLGDHILGCGSSLEKDFVEKVINSMDLCEFRPPVERPDIVSQGKPDWELLTTHSRIAQARRLLQLGNDNIGDDMAAHSGTVMIRGVPMVWSGGCDGVRRPAVMNRPTMTLASMP